MSKPLNFLIIEDDDLTRLSLFSMLSDYGNVDEFSKLLEGVQALSSKKHDIVFIDLDLDTELAGLELIRKAKQYGIYSVVISGREDDQSIEEAYTLGCEDYLAKPFNKEALSMVLKKFNFLSNQSILRDFFSKDYITQDKKLVNELESINEIILSERPVLLKGETGTGKTMMAKLIHRLIFDNMENFVHINCSEIPENLLESELFGHEKGSFSGATSKRKGRLCLADGGTLFLDEVATMPKNLQQKLLKAIEEKTFYPVGSDQPVTSNFRLISATCENLGQLVSDGEFRMDLYYRLEGHIINLTSLVDRPFDIPILIKHFIKKGSRRVIFSNDVIEVFKSYNWPGNIRELKKTIEILQVKKNGIIRLSDIPKHILDNEASYAKSESLSREFLKEDHIEFVERNGFKDFINKLEDEMVQHFYNKNDEKVRKTLKELKLSNSAFYRIMERLKPKEVEHLHD
jgi:DNA-binding NtrC family response regulator